MNILSTYKITVVLHDVQLHKICWLSKWADMANWLVLVFGRNTAYWQGHWLL